MSTFKWPLRISSMEGNQVQDIEAIVGTGAFYTTLPGSLLRDLGIEPKGRRRVPRWPMDDMSTWTTERRGSR